MEDAIKQSLGDRLLKLHKQTLAWNLTQAPRATVVPSHPGLVFNSKQSRVNRVYRKLYNWVKVLPCITVHSHMAMQWRHRTIMNSGTRYSVHWLLSSITVVCHQGGVPNCGKTVFNGRGTVPLRWCGSENALYSVSKNVFPQFGTPPPSCFTDPFSSFSL